MNQQTPTRPELWQRLKSLGFKSSRPYQNFSTAELISELQILERRGPALQATPSSEPAMPRAVPGPAIQPSHETVASDAETPLEIDEYGRQWFQKEVRKPSSAQPRGRRVVTYHDPGVETVTYKDPDGRYTETIEVPGKTTRVNQAKITLPSYQVGKYKDPSLPFMIFVYNGVRGFSMQEVWAFYGGPDLVPSTIKTIYVSNELCYDIASTRSAIEQEYRERFLARTI